MSQLTATSNVFLAGLGAGPPDRGWSMREPSFQELRGRLTANLMNREEFLRKLLSGNTLRDINKDCGYPDEYTPELYQELYNWNPVAARVVEVYPRESWQVQPNVYEEESGEEPTDFEQAWDNLGRQLRPEKSWHQTEGGSQVWQYLRRADELSGIGRYGIILFGFDDVNEDGTARDLSSPVVPGTLTKPRRLLYLRVFSEAQAKIAETEPNSGSPRFGQPLTYQITFANSKNLDDATGDVRTVHWSRVLHLSDNTGASETLGMPRMQQVVQPLLDIHKVRAGSAEMYWRGAFAGHAFVTHPQLGGDVEVDKEKMKEAYRNYANRLDRMLIGIGGAFDSLAPQVSDPTAQINVQIECICIKLGVPKRIFLGSERGELASTQDDDAWNDRLKERQENYLTPRVVVPFVDRLIMAGVLPEPKGYTVEWPDLTSRSDQEVAQVGLTLVQALAAYIQGNVSSLVTPFDLFSKFLGRSEAEAAAIVQSALEQLTETDDETLPSPLLSDPRGAQILLAILQAASAGGLAEDQALEIIRVVFRVTEEQAAAIWAEGFPEPEPEPAPPPDSAANPDPNQPQDQTGGGNGTVPAQQGA